MKKILLSAFVIISFALYAIYQNGSASTTYVAPASGVALVNKQSLPQDTSVGVVASNNSPSKNINIIPDKKVVAPPKTQNGLYKDGTYVGNVADAFYGNVQIKAIISGGKIADVQFLDYPQDRGHSVRLNSQAMPILTSEAIKAQNANVDIVSGATATSQAFQESLASALSQAKS